MYRIRIENLETGKIQSDVVTDFVFAVMHIPSARKNECLAVGENVSDHVLRNVLSSVSALICKLEDSL